MLYKSLILVLSNPKRLVLHPSCRIFIDCKTLGNYCGFKEYYNSPFLVPLGRVLLPNLQHASPSWFCFLIRKNWLKLATTYALIQLLESMSRKLNNALGRVNKVSARIFKNYIFFRNKVPKLLFVI